MDWDADEALDVAKRAGRRSSVSSLSAVSSTGKKSSRRKSVYSEWESQSYGPVVQMSWNKLQDLFTLDQISETFHETFGELCPFGGNVLSDKPAAAKHLLATLDLMVSSAETPDVLAERLKDLAQTHITAGVTLEHVKPFGEALMRTLAKLLGKQFNVQTKAAWRWIWTFSANAFTAVLKEATEESTVVCKSWEIANQNISADEIGKVFYDVLFSLAPNLQDTFSKDRALLGIKFAQMISTLVTFSGDPEHAGEQIEWLGVRHLHYKASHEHIEVMGQTLIQTMFTVTGEESWDSNMEKEWSELWSTTAEQMLEATLKAEMHIPTLQTMWASVEANSSAHHLGYTLRKSLLLDREWVSTVTNHLMEGTTNVKEEINVKKDSRGPPSGRTHNSKGQEDHVEPEGKKKSKTDAGSSIEGKSKDTDSISNGFTKAVKKEGQSSPSGKTLSSKKQEDQVEPEGKKKSKEDIGSSSQGKSKDSNGSSSKGKSKDSSNGISPVKAVKAVLNSPVKAARALSPARASFPDLSWSRRNGASAPASDEPGSDAPESKEPEKEKDKDIDLNKEKDIKLLISKNGFSAKPADVDSKSNSENTKGSFKAQHEVPFLPQGSAKNLLRTGSIKENMQASFKIEDEARRDLATNPFDRVASIKSMKSELRREPSMSRQNTFGRTSLLQSSNSKKGSRMLLNSAVSGTNNPIEEDLTTFAVSQDAEGIGQNFWRVLSELFTVIDQPEMLSEKVVVMMLFFYRRGVRSEHLEQIGIGLEASFARILGKAFGQEQHDAWIWFWSLTSKTMDTTLQALQLKHSLIVRESWEKCKDSATPDQLGDSIYAELYRLSPRAASLFKRPKSIQALQFVSAIDLMITFNENPGIFFEQLRPLIMRHIRYGVRADYARAFGKSVKRAIKTVLGPSFDEDTELAWSTLWQRVSSYFTRFLTSASGNLLAVALITEDVDKLKAAVDKAPRGDRFNVLTHLNVNGQEFAPLFWALENSQVVIAEFIISDLLEIRADRQAYYYGRAALFQEHPNLIGRICKEMPSMLPILFNGLLWHAQNLTDGHLVVNYYIAEMYGDPRLERDTWKSPLGVLCLDGRPEYFQHPVLIKLLDVKFNQFGLRIHLLMQGWYTSLVILYSIGIVSYAEYCDPVYQAFRLITLSVGCLTVAVLSMLALSQYRSGSMVKEKVMGIKFRLPRFFANRWNLLRFVSCILLIPCTFLDQCDRFEGEAPDGFVYPQKMEGIYLVQAITGLFLWVQQLQALLILPKFAALTYTIGCIMPEIIRNMVIIGVLFLSFASAMTCLRIDQYQEGFFGSILQLVQIVLGVADSRDFQLSGWGLVLLLGMIFMVQISLLNILFAQLSSNYQSLLVNQASFAMLKRAQICCEMESVLPFAFRLRYYDSLGFDKPLELEQGDTGPSGGIHVAEKALVRISEKYIPDRVKRFIGETDPELPWPTLSDNEAQKEMAADK